MPKPPDPKIGPTGKFPRGRLNKYDEGELRIAVAADPKKRVVVINFDTPVAWIAMPPAEAVQLAETIIANARKLGPVTVHLTSEARVNAL